MARTGDERRQQRREQRGAEGGEAAGVGPTGRVEPQFLRGRPVVADGGCWTGRCSPPRGCARRRRRAWCGERRWGGNGRRGPVVEHRAARGGRGRPGGGARYAAPRRQHGRPPTVARRGGARGGSRRSAGRRWMARDGRRSAGRLARAGRQADRPQHRHRGARGAGQQPSGGSFPQTAAPAPARSGAVDAVDAADGGHGGGGARASPVSGSRARPRWSPPGPPRDDTYGFDGAAAAAETPRRPCAAAAAGVVPRRRSTMRPGSRVLRVIVGSDGHPLGRVHPMSRRPPPGVHRWSASMQHPHRRARRVADGACRPGLSCRRDPGRRGARRPRRCAGIRCRSGGRGTGRSGPAGRARSTRPPGRVGTAAPGAGARCRSRTSARPRRGSR